MPLGLRVWLNRFDELGAVAARPEPLPELLPFVKVKEPFGLELDASLFEEFDGRTDDKVEKSPPICVGDGDTAAGRPAFSEHPLPDVGEVRFDRFAVTPSRGRQESLEFAASSDDAAADVSALPLFRLGRDEGPDDDDFMFRVLGLGKPFFEQIRRASYLVVRSRFRRQSRASACHKGEADSDRSGTPARSGSPFSPDLSTAVLVSSGRRDRARGSGLPRPS